jgi:hypothetical protein
VAVSASLVCGLTAEGRVWLRALQGQGWAAGDDEGSSDCDGVVESVGEGDGEPECDCVTDDDALCVVDTLSTALEE